MLEEFAFELRALRQVLRHEDWRAGLKFLNQRTPFRFTAVYRIEGEILRNVLLHDRWNADVVLLDDAPLHSTYCGIVADTGAPLEVADGRTDLRFPRMTSSTVLSYAGVPVRDGSARLAGTLCHFDLSPCQMAATEIRFLQRAAALFAPLVASAELEAGQ